NTALKNPARVWEDSFSMAPAQVSSHAFFLKGSKELASNESQTEAGDHETTVRNQGSRVPAQRPKRSDMLPPRLPPITASMRLRIGVRATSCSTNAIRNSSMNSRMG